MAMKIGLTEARIQVRQKFKCDLSLKCIKLGINAKVAANDNA